MDLSACIVRHKMVVRDSKGQHEDGHEKESLELDLESPNPVDEGNRHPIARNRREQRHQCLRACDLENLFDCSHVLGRRYPSNCGVHIFLKQRLAVKRDVKNEPTWSGAQELETVPAYKLPWEQRVPHLFPHTPGFNDFVSLRCRLDVQHPVHIDHSLFRIPCDESRVSRRLRHLQTVVERKRSRDCTHTEDDAPDEVGRRRCVRRGSRIEMVEDRRHRDAHYPREEDPESLHGEDCSNERPTRSGVWILWHDSCREWVVAANSETQPKSEETESRNHSGCAAAEREPGPNRGDDHQEQRDAVDFLAAQLVAEPAEEELPDQCPAQCHPNHCCIDVGRQGSGRCAVEFGVVEAAEELGDERDGEKIVSVSEETHSRYDNRREMVPLRLGLI